MGTSYLPSMITSDLPGSTACRRAGDHIDDVRRDTEADGRSALEGLAEKLWRVSNDGDHLAALAIARKMRTLLDEDSDEVAQAALASGASFPELAVAYEIS